MNIAAALCTIDLCAIEPRERHATVLDAFRSLAVADAIQVAADHELNPLYLLQLKAPGSFAWRDLQSRSERWRVSALATAVWIVSVASTRQPLGFFAALL
jgi:uncharacterized protein (DUF2249 family)